MKHPDDYEQRHLQPRGHHGQVRRSDRESLEGRLQTETQTSTLY